MAVKNWIFSVHGLDFDNNLEVIQKVFARYAEYFHPSFDLHKQITTWGRGHSPFLFEFFSDNKKADEFTAILEKIGPEVKVSMFNSRSY